MTTMQIEVDTYLDLVDLDGEGEPGVEAVVFLGNDGEAQLVIKATFAELLDKWIEVNSIPSNPPSMRQHHKDTASALLLSMTEVIEAKLGEIEDIELWVPRADEESQNEDDNRR
jgi:hypothetical protein